MRTTISTSAGTRISRRCKLRLPGSHVLAIGVISFIWPVARSSQVFLMLRISALAASLALLLLSPASAQEALPKEMFTQRQVTIVVPFAAGGSADLVARILQQHLQAKTGIPIVVENKSGAGGARGRFNAKAPADGDTLLLGTMSTHAINPYLYTPPELRRRSRLSAGLAPGAVSSICCSVELLPVHSVSRVDRPSLGATSATLNHTPRGLAPPRICRSSCSSWRPAPR